MSHSTLSNRPAPLQFVLKTAARCNLNCSYCYVFNKADQSWRDRPGTMPDDTFSLTIERIRRHCLESGQPIVRVMFHGGEPLLIGVRHFRQWLVQIDQMLGTALPVSLAIQTNGTLIDDEWAQLFLEHDVEVGISLDGPADLNDRFRVDHSGRGSYREVVRGIETLRRYSIPINLLSVVQPGVDGLSIYRHFLKFRPSTINFLFPDHNHDDIEEVRRRCGATPVADFLIPIADEWYRNRPDGTDLPLIRNIFRLLLGGQTRSDMFGNPPLGFVFIESDGEIEGLDVLRLDGERFSATGLNVHRHDFAEIATHSEFHNLAILQGMPLPKACRSCPEGETCAGGYLPHRYSKSNGFDNPSAWCPDILKLFRHLRTLLDVDLTETELRRMALQQVAAAG